MRIDTSKLNAWHFCPAYYQELYLLGIQKSVGVSSALEFGKRMHELLETHYRGMAGMWQNGYGPHSDAMIESEAQTMMAAYRAQYPQENFSVVEVENKFEIPIEGTGHILVGRMDGVVRMVDTKKLWLLEHKTEGANSRANTPEAWVARGQVGTYLWAGREIYGEEFGGILLNVLTRSGTASRVSLPRPPRFRRDSLVRTVAQQEEAIDNLVWAADQIEQLERTHGAGKLWPQDRGRCYDGWRKCQFYELHVIGRTPELLRLYEAVKKDTESGK